MRREEGVPVAEKGVLGGGEKQWLLLNCVTLIGTIILRFNTTRRMKNNK